jgi:hypothetical protein
MFTWIDGRLLLVFILIVVSCYWFVAGVNGALQAKANKDAARMAERRRIFEARGGVR